MDSLTEWVNGIAYPVSSEYTDEDLIKILLPALAAYEDNNQTPKEQAAMIAENAQLKEQLAENKEILKKVFGRDCELCRAEQSAVPKPVEAAIEELKQAAAYNGHDELSRAASKLWRAWDEWRGPGKEKTK